MCHIQFPNPVARPDITNPLVLSVFISCGYLKKVCLSFRSNKIVEDIPEDSDGVYCVKSLVGSIGGTTKHCIVIGILRGDNVAKKSWITPELLSRNVSPSLEKDCFPEGMIHNAKKSKAI